jgi:hypothetical protein
MSDHNWVLENLESYSAGGLNSDERERLEAHLPDCASCSKTLQDIRSSDEHLESLFSPIRPKPGFEDRMITSLRSAVNRNGFRFPMIGWVGASAAAAVVVGVVGASMDKVVSNRGTRGQGVTVSNNLKQIGSALHMFDPTQSMEADAKITEHEWYGASKNQDDLGDVILTAKQKDKIWSVDGVAREQAYSVEDLAQSLSERHLSELKDSGRVPAGNKEHWLEGIQKADAPQPVPATAKPEVQLTDNLPALKEANRPAQTATNPKDQPPATPPPPGFGSGAGFGFGGGGFGGSGGAGMQSMMGRMGTGVQPGGAGGPLGNTNGTQPGFLWGKQPVPNSAATGLAFSPDGKAATNFYSPPVSQPADLYSLYFRPGEQAAAEVQQGPKLDKGADKADPAKKQVADANQEVGKVNVNVIQDPKALGALQGKEGEKKENQPTTPAMPKKIIIRTGDIEFEVDSFDSAVATVTLLVNKIQGGFVDTVNSEKLPNGKVRGSVVVRMPPEHLDTYVLELRKELGKTGELKGQKIGSQDITKQYTDLESRLKAARAMETRLLDIIKTGRGEIKDLLVAEKELGVWRTKIEEYEGEKRYYDNQVSLSTLTISISEKEIRAPFAVVETERVQMGVEAEDVIKAQQQVLKAVDEAKGRVTKSELKQHAADQLNATINFEVAPDKTGTIRDRIEQLGRRTRLEVDRLQENEGGTGKAGEAKTRRKDSQFFLNIYNVANVAPRETVQLGMACVDVEDVYKKILARVEKASGRVVTSNLNRQRNDQTAGTIQFEVKSGDADAVLLEIRELAEVMRLQVTESADPQNTTRSKRGFYVQLAAMGTVNARETDNITLATRDVPAGYRALQDAVIKAKGRILNSQLNEQDKQNISANLDFEIRRADEPAVTAALKAAGDIYSQTVARSQDADNVIDSKVRYSISLINQARIPPRETITLGIEVNDVDKTAIEFTRLTTEAKGRTVTSDVARAPTGRVTAKLIYDVPFSSLPEMVNKFGAAGIVRVQQFSKNPQVPESDLAIARLDVTLSNSPLIVPSDEGFGTELRKGLATSVRVLSLSLSWLVFGLLVFLPWAAVIFGIYRFVTKLRRKPSPA